MRTYRFLFATALVGLLVGAIGFLAGGYIGATSCDRNIKEAGCVEPMIYGAIIGTSILMPVGVQLTYRRRGSFPLFLLTLLAVGGIAAVGLAVGFVTGLGAVIIAIPVVQLTSCVVIQYLVAKRPLKAT